MEPVEKKHLFIELRARGISLENIAKKLSVSKTTLINWSKELRLDINNARQLEKDSLIEKYKATQHYRLESLLKMFNKLNTELESRDFSDLPTAKLLEQIQLTYQLLNKEVTPVEISEVGDPFCNFRIDICKSEI